MRRTVDLGPIELQVEACAEKPQAQKRRRRIAEELFAELMATEKGRRRDRLREKGFRKRGLFELLLEAAQIALPGEPTRAMELVTLAGELCELAADWEGCRPDWQREGLPRAFCLEGTALRLLGKTRGAEEAFRRAEIYAGSSSARGLFCRSLALLRWDEGRTEEATALLHQAGRRFANVPPGLREQAVCQALVGLLQLELGLPWQAFPHLVEASRGLDPEGRPWLLAHCRLGLAFCFAFSGQPEKARSFRQTAWSLYSQLREEESLSISWLEGQVAAVSREYEEAEHLLDSVRRAQIARGCLPEATMASIDLGLVWVERERQGEIKLLADELQEAFKDASGLDFATGVLESLAREGEAGLIMRGLWTFAAFPLRMSFRSQGVFFKPVPFS